MEERLLQDIRDYLGNDFEEYNDTAIDFCIKRAISSFEAKRGYPSSVKEEQITKDMERFYYCIFDLVMYFLMKQGAEFESLHIENAVHRTYQSETDIYLTHGVFPLVRAF